MTIIDIHANELEKASGSDGVYRVNGVQDSTGDTLTIRKKVSLLPGAGAVIRDRIVWAGVGCSFGAPREALDEWYALIQPIAAACKTPADLLSLAQSDTLARADRDYLDGVTPEGMIFDAATGPNAGPSSMTIDGADFRGVGATLTNGYRAICVNPNQTATGLMLKRLKVHAVGKFYGSQAAADASNSRPEAWQLVDGRWVNNHDQGLYMNATGFLVDEVEVWDAAVRALQLRGSHHGRVMRFYGHDSGQIVMIGDLAASDTIVSGLFTNHRAKTRAAIAAYQAGAGNMVGGVGHVDDGRPLVEKGTAGVSVTDIAVTLDAVTGRIAPGSPAVGLVPNWRAAQGSTTPPPPPPVFVPDVATAITENLATLNWMTRSHATGGLGYSVTNAKKTHAYKELEALGGTWPA